MVFYKQFLILFICCLLTSNIVAQNQYNFEHITIKNGLSQSVVSTIAQDELGFLWIGTLGGLNRYDGKTIKKYIADPNSEYGLTNGYITSICIDSINHFIWVGTRKGLNRIDPLTHKIKKYYQVSSSDSLISNYINVLALTSSFDLLIGTNNGLQKYNLESEEFEIISGSGVGDFFVGTEVTTIHTCKNGDFWCGTEKGLVNLNSSLEIIQVLNLKINKITSVYMDTKSFLWIGTEQGLVKYNSTEKESVSYLNSNENNSLSNNFIRAIQEGPDGNMWFATEFGLNKYNEGSDSFETLFSDLEKDSKSLISNYIRSLFIDQHGDFWIGTVGGLNKMNQSQKNFQNFQLKLNSKKTDLISDSKIPVWGIVEDNGAFWVSTMGKGVLKYSDSSFDPSSCVQMKTVHGLNGIELQSVFFVNKIDQNKLLLGTERGLLLIDRDWNLLYRYYTGDDPEVATTDDMFLCNVIDPWGNIWGGTLFGLNKINLEKISCENFFMSNSVTASLSSNLISSLMISSDSILWVGTNNGVYSAKLTESTSAENIVLKHFSTETSGKYKLSSNSISSFFEDEEGSIWFATNKGLNIFNKELDSIIQYTEKDGLINDVIYSIVEDEDDNLWLSTNYGISCFNPKTKTFKGFNDSDGIDNLEFNSGANFKDKKGYIYFGGLNGITKFHPKNIHIDTLTPKVVITNIELFQEALLPEKEYNGKVLLKKSIEYTDGIILNYKQNFISFRFAALHYRNSQKNEFKCRLIGFQDEWLDMGNADFINYPNLRPGKFTFEVKASNCDGVWSNIPAKFNIIIKPPYWKTYWFIGIVIILVLIIVILYIKLRELNLRQEKESLEFEVRQRTNEIEEAKEELKQANAFVESIISNAKDGIAVSNWEGYFKLVNEAFCEMLQYTEAELLEMNFKDLTPDIWKEVDKNATESLQTIGYVYVEKEYYRKDGSILPIGITAAIIKDDAMDRGIISIIRDNTERTNNIKEIEKYQNHLEELVHKRTIDLQEAKEHAELSDQLKTSFLANMSHEVRTPLNSIVGFAQLINVKNMDDSQKEMFTNLILKNSESLLLLIEDIIDLSRIETGEIVMQQKAVDVNRMIQLIYSRYSNVSAVIEKNIAINLIVPDEVKDIKIESDQHRIEQVISNLLDNAIKFTDKGQVDFGFKINGKEIEFFVEDTGIGISHDKLSYIFNRFTKIENDSKKVFRGTGIGLSLSKKIVELLGGEIFVETILNKGSRFYFKLPLKILREEKIFSNYIKMNQMKYSDKTILIAEDEKNNYLFLEAVLKGLGTKILWAKNGEEAITYVKEHDEIDLILMDIKMPILNGIEATMQIKEFKPELPVVAQTAYAMVNDKENILNAGCDDYITKPIDLELLYELLDKYLAS